MAALQECFGSGYPLQQKGLVAVPPLQHKRLEGG